MERGIEREENGGKCLVNLCRTCREIILQMTDNPRLEPALYREGRISAHDTGLLFLVCHTHVGHGGQGGGHGGGGHGGGAGLLAAM